ncbi:SigE family RNA polymerase sigma factor [Kitasatospora sp. NPDC002040]|uniref:SigE family RNA polymerase sigma factor n=1 Tax=Kitasatospora sp. NPDC002040 TaxID=3154661 RepID=UPI003324FF91
MTVNGDPFDEFVGARYQALLRGAYLITGDLHDACDLLHDALARVYVRRRSIRDVTATEEYVRRTMVRTHISRWRRTRREVPMPELPDAAVLEFAPEDDRLRLVLRRLPPKQRAVVALKYYIDLPMAQVAEELGCSLATAKTHLARAMKSLRRELAQENVEVGRGC